MHPDTFPRVLAFDNKTETIYSYQGDVESATAEEITEFVDSVVDGKAVLPMKSEPVPD